MNDQPTKVCPDRTPETKQRAVPNNVFPKTEITDQDRATWKGRLAHLILACPVGILEEIAKDLDESQINQNGSMLKGISALAFKYRAAHTPKSSPGSRRETRL